MEEEQRTSIVRIRVSSKHMNLASPVFKAMLAPSGFLECRHLKAYGTVEVSLPDDDVEALTILLHIIHGRTKEVPTKVSLELLNKIAVVVDKYRLQDGVGFFSDSWVDDVKRKYPILHKSDNYLIKWLGISWVFRKKDLFNQATICAVNSAGKDFGNVVDDFPLPNNLLGMLTCYIKSIGI